MENDSYCPSVSRRLSRLDNLIREAKETIKHISSILEETSEGAGFWSAGELREWQNRLCSAAIRFRELEMEILELIQETSRPASTIKASGTVDGFYENYRSLIDLFSDPGLFDLEREEARRVQLISRLETIAESGQRQLRQRRDAIQAMPRIPRLGRGNEHRRRW